MRTVRPQIPAGPGHRQRRGLKVVQLPGGVINAGLRQEAEMIPYCDTTVAFATTGASGPNWLSARLG